MASRRTNGSRSFTAIALKLIKRGDLAGFSALNAQASAIGDRHERYLARYELVDAAITCGTVVSPARAQKARAIGARETIALLEEDPREPVLLNQAGVLMSQLACFGAAQSLFEAAQRLDPRLTNVAANLAEVVRRRRVPEQPPAGVLGELSPRAERVAARAQPAEGMTVSLCMIVKDEEEMLPRCLAAAAPAVDEIVIVDTGSSDRTIEIAQSFGARVIEREWTGDFSQARNVALDAATSDWLLVLDADEVLVGDDVPQLRELLGRTWREAFYVSEINYTGELDHGTAATHSTLRLFRARSEHRYAGRLHEQIVDALPAHLAERFEAVPVRIEHFGYLGAVRDAKEKSRRNIELLERQRDEGDDSPFLHFNLGSEYSALGDAPAALAEFERADELLQTLPEGTAAGYLPALTIRHVGALGSCGRYEDALELAERSLRDFPGFTDLVYAQGGAARALGRIDDAVAYYERCLAMGDAPSRYTATVGCGTYHPTIALAEILLERGEGARAGALLDACLADHPGFFGLVHPLAITLLAGGAEPGDVVERVEARVARLTPTVRFMLGTALYEWGEISAAEAQYRHLLEQQPGSGHARVALAEALLSQSRWEEAAAVAAELGDAEPHAAAARRSELFARLVGGDLDAAAAAIERDEQLAAQLDDEDGAAAASAVLPAGDRALFAAWLAAVRGEADGTTLPLASVPLLNVTLEALLRVQEVDAFGVLVPLLDRCPIPPREQRELRAGMYYRRGFLASAAEEWIAVCGADATDVRALVGLAQVAAAQEMPDEALDFAREAHALDPEDERATRLLEQLEPLAA